MGACSRSRFGSARKFVLVPSPAEMAAAAASDDRLQTKLVDLQVQQANKLKLAVLNAVAHNEPNRLWG